MMKMKTEMFEMMDVFDANFENLTTDLAMVGFAMAIVKMVGLAMVFEKNAIGAE